MYNYYQGSDSQARCNMVALAHHTTLWSWSYFNSSKRFQNATADTCTSCRKCRIVLWRTLAGNTSDSNSTKCCLPLLRNTDVRWRRMCGFPCRPSVPRITPNDLAPFACSIACLPVDSETQEGQDVNSRCQSWIVVIYAQNCSHLQRAVSYSRANVSTTLALRPSFIMSKCT